MAKLTNPETTLNNILKIIDSDVKCIIALQTGDTLTPLHPDHALTLTRYAKTLNDILDEQDKAKNRAKKDYEKMSIEELIALHQSQKRGSYDVL